MGGHPVAFKLATYPKRWNTWELTACSFVENEKSGKIRHCVVLVELVILHSTKLMRIEILYIRYITVLEYITQLVNRFSPPHLLLWASLLALGFCCSQSVLRSFLLITTRYVLNVVSLIMSILYIFFTIGLLKSC